MEVQDTDIIAAVRAGLTERLGTEKLRFWLSSPQALQWSDGAIVVRAADPFTLERLRRQLRGVLEDIVLSATGSTAAIRYQVDPQLKRGSGEPARETARTSRIDPNQKCFAFFTEDDSSASASASGESQLAVVPQQDVQEAGPASPEARRSRAHGSAAKSPGRKFASLATFITGQENRLAFTAAESLHTRLGSVSPLFVFGPTGSGKTHLLEGIWSSVRKEQPNRRCLYLAAEQFTAMFLEALQGKGVPGFRRKYREADLFIIDDIQFLRGKKATQQELLAVLDYFTAEQRQLVLAADDHPARLSDLPEELSSRIASGLVLGLEPAGEELKGELLNSFLRSQGQTFSGDVVSLLARELPGDVRIIRGAVNRLMAWQEATGAAANMKTVRELCRDLFVSQQRMIHLVDIEKAICEVFRISPKSLQSATKARAIAQPRMLALWLSRKYTRAGVTEIGQHFGLKSHSTVVAANKKVDGWLAQREAICLDHQECTVNDALQRVEQLLRSSG